MPARKRTKFMTNSTEIANELSWKCPKDHLYQASVGERAHKAAVYPDGLCEAICRGLKKAIQNECQGVDDSAFHGQNWYRYEQEQGLCTCRGRGI